MNISEAQSAEIEKGLKERERLRAEKKFAEADQMRQELESRGFLIMDGPDGSTWSTKE
jgi:cysteinyl-tRNA synthetase